ncbi:MAG TPA: polymer-forming cytoskeletal protein [Methylocystis sp.]|nr:polymer-forming cytoskeletal protein [Methylocystis sp.]
MSEFRSGSGSEVYVGAGARVSGLLRGGGRVEIHGEVDGEIACDRLVVGVRGAVSGDVSAQDADISGSVRSRIAVAHRLKVRAEGRVEGVWSYVELEVEKGGVLRGDATPASVPPGGAAPRPRTGVRRLKLVYVNREPLPARTDTRRAF